MFFKGLTIRIFAMVAVAMVMAVLPSGCIEDDVTTSPADQPEFSTDTLDFGYRFTEEVTSTMRLMVYNRHDKVISISDISLEDSDSPFMLNVDGQSGRRFSGIEIRPNDSIYVLVSANIPAGGSYAPVERESELRFTTNGVTKAVVLKATTVDADRIEDYEVTGDETWGADRARIIYGRLHVAEGATLTLTAGTTLFFHDKAMMEVDGRLISRGRAGEPVNMRGSRIDNVLGDISFDLMSGQWDGVWFTSKSSGNELEYTVVANTVSGVRADSTDIRLTNCRLRNSTMHVLETKDCDVRATGCEFAEAAGSLVKTNGGNLRLANCTLSNYYLFAAIRGAALEFVHTDAYNLDEDDPDAGSRPYVEALIDNSIVYGSMSECNMKDLAGTQIYFKNCLMRSNGTDDENFIDTMWGVDPLFYTDRSAYIFDYRLQPESPALGMSVASDVQLPETDFYGGVHTYPAAIGAYEGRED